MGVPAAADARPLEPALELVRGGRSGLLLGVAALSPGDAWAVGYQYLSGGGAASLAAHWDGSAWTAASTPQPAGATYTELAGAAALRPGTVWVAARAGYEAFVLHTTNG